MVFKYSFLFLVGILVCSVDGFREDVIYEDRRFVLKRYVRHDVMFDYILVIKDLGVELRLYSYEGEDFGIRVYNVVGLLRFAREPWRNMKVSRSYHPEDGAFRKLMKSIGEVRNPRDFILVFMDFMSPALAILCREVVSSENV